MDENRMISVAMLAHEDEEQLPETLEQARKVADELIVVDSYSEDATADIAEEYGAEVYQTEWRGFADTWQFALDKATGDWVLQLASDEVLSDAAIERIREIDENDGPYDGYKIFSINLLGGREIPHWTRHAPRLFRSGHGRISDSEVHESIQLDGEWGKIDAPLYHYTLDGVSEHLSQMDEYTRLAAKDIDAKPSRLRLLTFPLWRLVWSLFRQRLILDGGDGIYIAVMDALDAFLTTYRARLKFDGVEEY